MNFTISQAPWGLLNTVQLHGGIYLYCYIGNKNTMHLA